ncbi:exo-alpha-sialidase [Candidatus Binatia bacterium]|nr:exo-alpha-sialidase [Candidatus Binatia bacterium]
MQKATTTGGGSAVTGTAALRRARNLALAAAVAGGLLAPAYAYAADPVPTHGVGEAWGPEVQVTASGLRSAGSVGRKIAADSTGRLHLVWADQQGSWYRILYAHSDDGGATWSEGVDIGGNETNRLPALGGNLAVGPDDTVHVAWNDRRLGGTSRIFYRRSCDRGDTWTDEPNDVSGAADADPAAPSLSVDLQGRVHVAWHHGNPDQTTPKAQVYYARSTDGGETFSEPMRLSTVTTEHAAWPRFSVDGTSGEVVAVVWRDQRRRPDWDVYLAVSSDGGETFVERAAIATDARDWDPDVLVDPLGPLHLTWTVFDTASGAPPSVRYARSPDLGVTWEAETTVSEARSKLSSWASDPWRGVLWLWWKDERDALPPPSDDIRSDVALRYSLDGGTTWSPLEFATDAGAVEARFPGMGVGPDGSPHVMWSDRRDGEDTETVFVRNRATGAGSGDVRLSRARARLATRVSVGAVRTRKLWVKNRGDTVLAGRIGSLSPPFAVAAGEEPFSLEPGELHPIEIEFAPTVTGEFADVLVVRTTDLDTPEISVEVSVTGK